MTHPNPEYEKFKDSAVYARELEAALGRLRMAAFWAGVGPAAVGLLHALDYTPARWMIFAILATIPLSLILLVVYYVKLPATARFSRPALTVAVITVILALATVPLASHFSLLKLLSSS